MPDKIPNPVPRPKRKRATRKAPIRSAAAPAAPEPSPVPAAHAHQALLRLPGEHFKPLMSHLSAEELTARAKDWNYRLRDRRRWATRGTGVADLRKEAFAFLGELGIHDELLASVARSRIVQVDLPAGGDPWRVALRRLPWEYLLASATRPLRGELTPFTVVRRLRDGAPNARADAPRRWLMVESAPGILHDEFDFTSEREVVERSARACEAEFDWIESPTSSRLAEKLATPPQFDVVHLAGFDLHQAADTARASNLSLSWSKLMTNPSTSPTLGYREGYVLAGVGAQPAPIDAASLASLFAAGQPPKLVTCNIFNSAYEIAAALVERGAQSAIGFQDTFDDELAEQFFATFFRAWPAARWNPISAFCYAWEQIRARKVPLHGSGLVLWTTYAIEQAELIDEEAIRARTHVPVRIVPENVRSLLEVRVGQVEELNYSILHNKGPLFREFVIRKKDATLGEVEDISVNVELNVGTSSYSFRTMVSLGYSEPQIDLKGEARVSLASALNRALRESVRSSLYVSVDWRDVTLHRRTYPVTLLSVDEWRDDDENRKWLPSFVLPRDPVVPQIIDRAQKYLMALQDDPTTGFDGYQSVDDPGTELPANVCVAIDQQVRAIWAALIYDTPLAYINPPPTFTDSSQRLRTPSDVINGKRGTCIDLALLLASCLEYVEIYPTIILLKTHAFPAYWRHNVYHENFSQARTADQTPLPNAQEAEVEMLNTRGQSFGWYFERPDHFREIMGEIQAGRLVPLETVSLTARAAYGDALVDGYKNLGNKREFDSMLDIQLARQDERSRVTPLPILRADL